MSESGNPPKRECLLTASGSQEVNGSYTQTSEEDLFYKKKYTAGDPAGIVYIITLESLPELGEDFEVAWALQSHDTDSDEVVTFYATPCDEPEAAGFPLKGWITVSGVEPVPRIFPRPVQRRRDRTSTLDIIEENMEQDFPIEPFWANDNISPLASEEENLNVFSGWDKFGGDDDNEDFDEYDEQSSEGDDSDYGEVELPDNIMENFKDGTFVHKVNQEDTQPADEQPLAVSPRGGGSEVDSDTSEDITVVRHEANRDSLFDQSENPSKPLISSQVDEKGEFEEEEEGSDENFELLAQRQMESGKSADNDNADDTEETQVDLLNPHLAYARSLGKKDDITIVDLRTEPPSITAAPVPPGTHTGSTVMSYAKVGSGHQDKVDFRVISPPYKPLIAPPRDPFISSITVHSRSRPGRDHVDVDLISAVVPPEIMKSPRNEQSRRKSQRKRQGKCSENVEEKTIDSAVGIEEKLDIVTNDSSPQSTPELKADVEVSRSTEKERDSEREKLEEEMHQLKTKMRKCDRLSKLRKRGRNLTKEQQETFVHRSKYQKRIEDLRRQLGSDIKKS
jgi:hypothetical protein